MEFVEGKNLTDIKLDSPEKKLDENEVIKYAIQIAKGLSYAHSKNIIHRDIKPQNILFSEENEIKIMDFGISETVRTSMSRLENTGTSGTLVYMSPEQISGKNVGRESDIYSFGALLYELLTGHPPFHTGAIEHQILNVEPEKIDGISGKLNNIILKCLRKNYKERFRSFEEVLKALESGIKGRFAGDSFTNFLGMKFVYIKPGTFMMGSPLLEFGRGIGETRHKVTLTKGFYMQTTEVTIGQFRQYLKATGNESGVEWSDKDGPINRDSSYSLSGNKFGKSNSQPMVDINWHAAKAFADWLSKRDGKKYRLPTEAEWEYAARAGTRGRFAGTGNLDDMGWYDDNSGRETHEVGTKKPNQWGLYDMHGNVYEWCEDRDGDYPSGDVTDPAGPDEGSARVVRGGGWGIVARFCRGAFRRSVSPGYASYNVGFRLVAF